MTKIKHSYSFKELGGGGFPDEGQNFKERPSER